MQGYKGLQRNSVQYSQQAVSVVVDNISKLANNETVWFPYCFSLEKKKESGIGHYFGSLVVVNKLSSRGEKG